MLNRNRPGNAIAFAALFVALGGGAFAAGRISTDDIQDRAVTKDKIATEAVTAKKIKDGVIGTGKLRDASVSGAKLADGSVGPASIKAGAITDGKLSDDAVTGDTLARIAEHTAQEGVDNNAVESVTAECDSGEVLVSGGGGWVGANAGVIMRSSWPAAGGGGWTVSGQNASGGIKQLSATALCLGDQPDAG